MPVSAEIHICSQLVYLNLPPGSQSSGAPVIGGLADYYLEDDVGRRRLQKRLRSVISCPLSA